MRTLIFLLSILLVSNGCNKIKKANIVSIATIYPHVITDTTLNDTDDPAIWYNKNNPEQSLILGTDKGDSTGGIFVFTLSGELLDSLSRKNMHRPNNIDIAYGFSFNNSHIDIAVCTERGKNTIRVMSVPDMKFIDNGGIPVFVNDSLKDPMGIALYTNSKNEIFAFVGRKTGISGQYIHQYKLIDAGGYVTTEFVRSFGAYSGKKEIEAIAVDNELGYVYYSDELYGVRKYYADAEKGNEQLAFFADSGFVQDQEGISIYKYSDGTGFIIVSNQQDNSFYLYPREGTESNPHAHPLQRIVYAKTVESDGNDILNKPFGKQFPHGIFVAMSNNKTFHIYDAADVIGIQK